MRAISEAFKLNVDWDGETKTVIVKNGIQDVVEPEPTPVSTPEPTSTPIPAPVYDDATQPINDIKSYISKGLYLEAMELCDGTVAKYNLSPDDKKIISNLYDTAEANYDDYLANSKPIYTNSAFSSLKNSIMLKGTYNKYGKYAISKYYDDSLTALEYDPNENDISISVLAKDNSGDTFVMLTIMENENPYGGIILTVGTSELTMLFEYVNGRRVTIRNDFTISSSLNSSVNNLVDTSVELFDIFLGMYTNVTLADFGVYY